MPCWPRPRSRRPATTATAIGRNSGSTMRDRGGGEERAVGEHRGQERRPVPGPRRDVGDREQHRDDRGQRASSQDRHPGPAARTSWPSSTPITAGRVPVDPVAAGAGHAPAPRPPGVRRSAASARAPDAAAHQPGVEGGRVVGAGP